MADDRPSDQSISVGRDAVNSVITSGNGNTVIVYQTIAAVATPTQGGGKNPYLGLLAFTEVDADRFFGREKLVAELWDRFHALSTAPLDGVAHRLLAILGPSGSGKSSVARAGLLAELARRPIEGRNGQRVAVLTPGDRPLEALAAVLARVATGDAAPAAKTREFAEELARPGEGGVYDGLRRIAASLPDMPGQPLVVLVDQFEEIYSLCHDPDERKIFVETILTAARDRGGAVSAIVTMRTDFLGSTQSDGALNQVLARQNLIVPSMSETELRSAIAEPARRAGRPLDEDTIRRLVDETAGRDGALPLLQFVLVRAWEGMLVGKTAGATVDELGGVGGALGAEAERIYLELSPPDQLIARRAFLAMVSFNENMRPTRHRALVSQLVADDEAVPDDQELADVLRVLERFGQTGSRLVTLSADAAGVQTVEVSHEAIFQHWERLKQWLADGQDDIRLHLRIAEAATRWDGAGRPEGSLWRPPDLDLLGALAAKPTAGLTAAERAFFNASAGALAKERSERNRRERIIQMAAAIFLVLALGAAGAGWTAFQQSLKATVQRSNAFAATARQAIGDGDSGRAMLLALAALPRGRESDPAFGQARAALQSALLNLTEVQTLIHPREVMSARFLAADRRIATVSGDSIVRIWDTASGRLLKAIPEAPLAEISPDRLRLATFGKGREVRIWDAATGELVVAIPGASDASGVSFSADARRIAIAWSGEPAEVRETLHGGRLSILGPPLDSGVDYLALSPNGLEAVTVTEEGDVQVWDAVTGKTRGRPLYGPVDIGSPPIYSADGRFLAVGEIADDSSVRLWDARTLRLIKLITGGLDPAFSPDGGQLVVNDGGEAKIFESATGEAQEGALSHSDGYIAVVRFSADGHQLVTASSDHTAQIWNVDTGSPAGLPLAGHGGTVNDADFSRDGRLVVTAAADGAARVWRTFSGPLWRPAPAQPDSQGRAPTGGGDRLLAYADGALKVFDRRTGALVAVHSGAIASGYGAAISKNGLRVATFGGGQVRLWNAVTGAPLGQPFGARGVYIRGLAFSDDGERLVTAAYDPTARIWNPMTGAQVGKPLNGHQGMIESASFSPDGTRVVTGSGDYTARIWDVAASKTLVTLKGHYGRVDGAAFSHDGRHVVTRSGDQTVRVWDAADGRLEATIPANVTQALFSPDDRVILTYELSALKLWDAATGQPLMASDVPNIRAAGWSPDGKDIVVILPEGALLADLALPYGPALRAEACRRMPRDFTDEERRAYGLGRSATGCTGPDRKAAP